ncbi:ligase-associated DNA damage response exonuclease [Paracoccus sp. (in: a-proteobacteria)]|uniref:ligase-associated DNA damage response exonuclease n=1 Tax=Paracoccus sp. TaxID=267 RepID=UPI0026E0DA87|nr:ligase-associated DNA damage response exonuclease [Paracoccus sp. (in: a-proteobacteria)]MDO5647149.1 ligase-associated DNA damage response exonuclease [Paracoccus sp. (in: a-proteobacteria)]
MIATPVALHTVRADDVLRPTERGLYCPPGDFYIDPLHPVPRALITHAHADHARPGHGAVLATAQTLEIMAIRYGADFAQSTQAAQGAVRMGAVTVSFHPAGHILGSAQIRVAPDAGPVIVVSGDYCRRPNPVCAPFEPVPCNVFVTEATFGLPVFRHPEPLDQMARLTDSLRQFPDRPHLIGAYALGKAQRLISLARMAGIDGPIAIHGALQRLCDYHMTQGIDLGPLIPATAADTPTGLVIAPPSAFGQPWVQRFRDPVIGFASGWMQVRARARQRGAELPLIISDHVDWPQLTQTLTELAPDETWITHGAEDGLMRWCAMAGLPARPLRLVGYGDEPE